VSLHVSRKGLHVSFPGKACQTIIGIAAGMVESIPTPLSSFGGTARYVFYFQVEKRIPLGILEADSVSLRSSPISMDVQEELLGNGDPTLLKEISRRRS